MTISFRTMKSLIPCPRHHEGPGFASGSMKPGPDRYPVRMISEENKVKIREEFADGKTQKEIGKDYGVTQTTISKICRGVVRRKGQKPGRRLPKDEKAKIREEFAEWKTLRKLAKEHDISYQAVSYICRGVERKRDEQRLTGKVRFSRKH